MSRQLPGSIPSASLTRGTIGRKVAPTLAAAPSLLYWRMERGLLQTELAEQAGVNRATVARLEQGAVSRLDTIRKLADALGISPGDLQRDPPTR